MAAALQQPPADHVLHWTSSFTGLPVTPGGFGRGGAASPDTGAGASVDPLGVPRPMPAGTKVVHGKVPGPKNHLLTVPDGFVVDVDAKTVIANSLADYMKAASGAGAGAGSKADPVPADPGAGSGPQASGGGGRSSVAAAAKAMMGRGSIHARKLAGPENQRQGWEDLLAIFELAAPAFVGRPGWVEKVLKPGREVGTTNGIPHWCGIFALYATKTGGVSVGTWKPGTGIGAVGGFRVIRPKEVGVGDIVVKKANVHHAVVIAVDGDKVTVINGNSGGDSSITQSSGRISDYDGGCYSAFPS